MTQEQLDAILEHIRLASALAEQINQGDMMAVDFQAAAHSAKLQELSGAFNSLTGNLLRLKMPLRPGNEILIRVSNAINSIQ